MSQFLLFFVSAAHLLSGSNGAIWYVHSLAAGSNTGHSWSDAFVELQSALAVAQEGDQIWVAQGTYLPDYDVSLGAHTSDRKKSFRMVSGVALYGGFAGTESTLGERSGLFDQTILSGDIGHVDFIEDNSFHVLLAGAVNSHTLLDGFMITNGMANLYPDSAGGGMLMYNDSEMTLRSCAFVRNRAITGGAIYNSGAIPTIDCCSFQSNVASYSGGAITINAFEITRIESCSFRDNVATIGAAVHSDHSGSIILDSTFEKNEAFLQGGGINNSGGSTQMKNCDFRENMAVNGGAISNDENAFSLISNCYFRSNVAHQRSGAIDNSFYCYSRIEHSVFVKNESLGDGGAITFDDESSARVHGCEFQQNIGGSYGGGLLIVGSNLVLSQSKFMKNKSQFAGGGLANINGATSVLDTSFLGNESYYGGGASIRGEIGEFQNCTFCQNIGYAGGALDGDDMMITNAVIWENRAQLDSQIHGPAQVKYSVVQDGFVGTGNTGKDPLFEHLPDDGNDGWGDDPATPFIDEGANDDFGDLRLQPNSPAINAGDPAFVPEPGESDLDGHARFLCGRVDMGAYEFGIGDVNCDQAVDLGDFAAWPPCSLGATPLPTECVPMDFDNDGDVDLADFAALQRMGWSQ